MKERKREAAKKERKASKGARFARSGGSAPVPPNPTVSVLIRMKGRTPLHSGRGFKCVRAPNPRSRHNFCGGIYCPVSQHQAPCGCPVLPARSVSRRPRLAVASRSLQGLAALLSSAASPAKSAPPQRGPLSHPLRHHAAQCLAEAME